MKRAIFLTAMVMCLVFTVQAQPNPNCIGLKNPTNFTLSGSHNEKWTGYTGSKNATESNCTGTEGGTYGAAIQASQLEAVNNSDGCTIGLDNGQTRSTSRDIHNQLDHSRQFVIKGPGTDPETFGHLSYLPPDTSFHSSIRLGNYCGNHGAEKLTYELRIQPENAMVTIWFALSLQNGQHSAAQNPEFVIMVEKNIGTTANPNWQPLAHDTLCYIRPTPVDYNPDTAFRVGATGAVLTSNPNSLYGDNLYLPWRKVMINLVKYIGQTIRIRMTAGDCSMSAHYAMAYIAGDCQSKDLTTSGCAAGETSAVTTVKAPKGAISYAWYRSKYGKLNGTEVQNMNNYQLIAGAELDSLNVTLDHFTNVNTGATEPQSTIMCRMTTKMNDTKSVTTDLPIDVGNTKPMLVVDSALDCDAGITLWDYSFAPYTMNNPENYVDTNLTQWEFYTSYPPTPATLVGTYTGGHATHTFDQAGTNYSVKVRSSASNTTCWNEKTVQIRTVKRPVPRTSINKDLNTLCKGDTIYITDLTQGSGYHRWTFSNNDTTYTVEMLGSAAATRLILDTTTRVTLLTRSRSSFRADTTGDGIVEDVFCYSDTTFDIVVGQFPKLRVLGDTIVCNGDQSNVTVQSDLNNCTFNWYQVLGGNTPVVENNANLVTNITQDRTYYVKVVSPFGCTTWDSINLYLVKPDLTVDRDKICTGDTATLTAGKAAYFDWTSNPPDPNLIGQETSEVIKVSPEVTTTYSVVGHGTNGCGATALTKKITVYPYPIMHVQLTPGYIDSENPSVQFSDQSEYGATSLWNFGNGNTSQVRTVVFTFTDLSQDSILISLVTGNALGCTSDTAFYVPVGIFAVWFPNAFTPKMETNNVFKPFTANTLQDYELHIFDRGGNLVFSTKDIEEGWDGTYKGHDCKNGSYVYIATYRREGVERLMSQKGTVTLVR